MPSVSIIDYIKEMDVTSVTSPIGLWTAARKPIVSDLGSAILKISGACWEKNNTDSTYMGVRRSNGRSGEVAIGCEGWISRALVNQPVNQDVATP